MPKVSDILTDKTKWLKGTWASKLVRLQDNSIRDELCFSNDKDAVCFCLIGAIRHCYRHSLMLSECSLVNSSIEENEKTYYTVLQSVVNHLNLKEWSDILEWNDNPSRTFEEVRDVIDKCDI